MLSDSHSKHCPNCSTTKPVQGNFYKSASSSDGYSGYCIVCQKARANAWHRALPPDRRVAKNARDTAKRAATVEARVRRSATVQRWINKSPENLAKQRAWQAAYKKRDPYLQRIRNAVNNNRRRYKALGLEPNDFQFLNWFMVLEQFEHRCAFCGAQDALLDLEHLVPAVEGGANTVGNVVPACRPCNAQKNRRTLAEFSTLRGITPERIAAIKRLASGNL